MPDVLDENYYIRSKQEAERLVVAARQNLANACIHRVGNLVFAAEGGPLQTNIGENAFFRQIAAFLRLGVVPDDSHLWLCHVDLVARGLVLLAGAADLTNETHHLENARRDRWPHSLPRRRESAPAVSTSSWSGWKQAVDEPEMDAALAETLETFGLYRGIVAAGAGAPAGNRLRAHAGPAGPAGACLAAGPAAGQAEMLRQASRLFSGPWYDASGPRGGRGVSSRRSAGMAFASRGPGVS